MSVRIATIGAVLSAALLVGCQSPPEDPFPEAKVGGKLTPPPLGAGSCQFGWSYRSKPFAKGVEKGQFFAVDVLADDNSNIIAKRVFAMAGQDYGLQRSALIRVTYTFQIPEKLFAEPKTAPKTLWQHIAIMPFLHAMLLTNAILDNHRVKGNGDLSQWIKSANYVTAKLHPSRGRTFRQIKERYLQNKFELMYADFLYSRLIRNSYSPELTDAGSPDDIFKPGMEEIQTYIFATIIANLIGEKVDSILQPITPNDAKDSATKDDAARAIMTFLTEISDKAKAKARTFVSGMIRQIDGSNVSSDQPPRLDEMVASYMNDLTTNIPGLRTSYHAIAGMCRQNIVDMMGYMYMLDNLFLSLPYGEITSFNDADASYPVPFNMSSIPLNIPYPPKNIKLLQGATTDGFDRSEKLSGNFTIRVRNLGNRIIQYEITGKADGWAWESTKFHEE